MLPLSRAMEDNCFSRCNCSTDKACGYLVTIVLLVQFTGSVQRLERKREETGRGAWWRNDASLLVVAGTAEIFSSYSE